jgi:hypothetical protein
MLGAIFLMGIMATALFLNHKKNAIVGIWPIIWPITILLVCLDISLTIGKEFLIMRRNLKYMRHFKSQYWSYCLD